MVITEEIELIQTSRRGAAVGDSGELVGFGAARVGIVPLTEIEARLRCTSDPRISWGSYGLSGIESDASGRSQSNEGREDNNRLHQRQNLLNSVKGVS